MIKEVKETTPLNPFNVTVKEGYNFLLARNVTMREVEQEGRLELIPCKVKERLPTVPWSDSYR